MREQEWLGHRHTPISNRLNQTCNWRINLHAKLLTRRHSSVGSSMNGSFFNLGLTNSATKLSSWLSHRLSSSPNNRRRSALFISLNCTRVFLICESSCSAAVLQSGARWVGVGLGAGVGGEAGAEGRRL